MHTDGWMLGPAQQRLLLHKQQDNDDSTSTVNTMDLLISGLGALTACSANPNLTPARDSVTVDEDSSSSSSSSPVHNFHYQTAGTPVEPGEALTVDCGNGDDETEKVVVPLSELERDGVCLDTLDVRPSSTVGINWFRTRRLYQTGRPRRRRGGHLARRAFRSQSVGNCPAGAQREAQDSARARSQH